MDNLQKLAEAEKRRKAMINDLYDMIEVLEGRPVRPQRKPNLLFDTLENVIGKVVDSILRHIPQYKRVRK